MSTIVCHHQDFTSRFDQTQPTETTMLKLKLAAPPPQPPTTVELKPCMVEEKPKNLESGSWSFLQSLTNTSTDTKEHTYIHPMTKKSSFSCLSQKSLELCTENLGCETGTRVTDSSIFTFSDSSSPQKEPEKRKQSRLESSRTASKLAAHDFPPPLTTMSGPSSLQVRPHREDGRLIIEAVEGPFRNGYLQAERSNGRLRLCFLDSKFAFPMNVEEQEEECDGEIDDEVHDTYNETDINDENEMKDCDYRLHDEDDDDDDDGYDDDGLMSQAVMDVEMGMEKFQRPSRCKEGGHGNHKGLCNWKPTLWVATS